MIVPLLQNEWPTHIEVVSYTLHLEPWNFKVCWWVIDSFKSNLYTQSSYYNQISMIRKNSTLQHTDIGATMQLAVSYSPVYSYKSYQHQAEKAPDKVIIIIMIISGVATY